MDLKEDPPEDLPLKTKEFEGVIDGIECFFNRDG